MVLPHLRSNLPEPPPLSPDHPQASAAELRGHRDRWVEARLFDVFMRNVYTGAPLQVAIALATGILLWQELGHQLVALWLVLTLLLVGLRQVAYARYLRHYSALAEHGRLARFKRQISVLWIGGALVWVLAFWLCYGKVSISLQAAFLLIMVAFVAMAMDRYAAWLAVLYGYTSLAFGGVIGVMLLHILARGLQPLPVVESFLVVVIGLCWLILLMSGERFHQVLRSTYRLQYRNQQLTRSLTRKTEAAVRAAALKNRLLAAASHDIRQPIHALSLYAQYLQDDPSQGEDLAPRIVQASRAVNSLFDSLLNYAQMEAGGLSLNVVPVRLDQLLHDLGAVYEALAKDKGLTLRLRVPNRAIHVLSDPVQLRRVLGNLLDNAIKYTHSGGVLLALQERGRGPRTQVRVSVVDTGQGIPDLYHQDIFGEFVTAPSVAQSPATGGVGLGLAIVSRLTQVLGHGIGLRSRPGRGSSFQITLDDTATQAAQTLREARHGISEKAGVSGRVLL